MKEIMSVSLVLFSVIDILGSLPIIMDLKQKVGKIHPGRATIAAGVIMIAFLFLGESILKLLGLDISSFAIAGGIILFFLGLEMVLGIRIFRGEIDTKTSTIVPLAFPLIAGTGTMTTLLSIRAEFDQINVIIGIIVNLIFVFWVLYSADWLEKKIGNSGMEILRKVFGTILLAIAVKLVKTNLTL